MARILYSALIESIVGKLAGSVFQDSYGGYQVRTRVSPRNPQTYYQQLRRGEFGYITQMWRSLTAIEQATWIAAAVTPSGGLNLYIETNVNLSLINGSLQRSFVAAATPGAMPMIIPELGSGIFTIQASGSISTVPANNALLLYATYEKEPSKIFTNPSQYSPIAVFAAGVDFSGPIDIAADWIARYGQFTSGKRVCIKTVLIASPGGQRGLESISCATEIVPPTWFIIDRDGTLLIDSDSMLIISQ